MFIEVTDVHNIQHSININNIVYIYGPKDVSYKCVIIFNSGCILYVKETYNEVKAKISFKAR